MFNYCCIFIILVLSCYSINADYRIGFEDLLKAVNESIIAARKPETTTTSTTKKTSKGKQCLDDEKCIQLGEKIYLIESKVSISG